MKTKSLLTPIIGFVLGVGVACSAVSGLMRLSGYNHPVPNLVAWYTLQCSSINGFEVEIFSDKPFRPESGMWITQRDSETSLARTPLPGDVCITGASEFGPGGRPSPVPEQLEPQSLDELGKLDAQPE